MTEDEHGKAMRAIVLDVMDAAGIDRTTQDMMIEYAAPKIVALGPPPGWGNYGTRGWAAPVTGIACMVIGYLLGALS